MTPTSPRTYGGQTGEERAAQRRLRLVEACLELIGEQGVAGTTVRGVIARAAIPPRYFYEAFESLDEMYQAVFQSVIAEVLDAALTALRDGPRRSRQRINHVLGAVVDVLLDDPGKGRIVLVESLSAPALGPLRVAAAQQMAEQLARHSEPIWRGLSDTDPAVLAASRFAIGGFGEVVTAALDGDARVDREALVSDLTELFLGVGVAFNAMAARRVPS